jgi:chorismate mutase/prephenate dehydratase
MFRVAHHPGSLVGALDIFKQNKLNLTWIESFPAKLDKPEYVFFVDFEGHIDDVKVKKALTTLEGRCEQLAVLGSFPKATVSG